MKLSLKTTSLLFIAGIYALAAIAGIILYVLIPGQWWLRLLFADVFATAVVFVFSVLVGNASVYDPYWSVQPFFIAAMFAFTNGTGGAGAFALIVVALWSVRLTGNWIKVFSGFGKYEDWRYVMLRKSTKNLYPLVNFLGIHLIPTLIVYACTLPVAVMILSGASLNFGAVLFLLLALCSVGLEFTADSEMHRFKASGRTGFIRTGVWKYSRHPNYLGEITFWWFLAFAMICVAPDKWDLFIGAVANTILFFAVSIPMMERRQAQKPGFEEYKAETRLLLSIKK